ncbi:MAG: 3'-5' exoribonuclease [Bdellovibrionales bacterium]|nr:3'-5' exoribonuclease [Bdellovibrionales bacterium]
MTLIDKPWQNFTFVAFDTETTGKYPLESEICEIAAVKWQEGEIVDTFHTLLKPSQPMSEEVIKIHNITNEMVKEAPLIENKIGEFHQFIQGAITIAHHAPFDLGFLAIEFEKANLSLPEEPVICSSLLSRKMIKESSNHKLQTLIRVLKIDGGQAHRALDDAKACFSVALECFRRVGENETLSSIFMQQGGALWWKDYSMESLLEESKFQHLIRAIKDQKNIELIYEGGSRPGKPRVVQPIGVVRNPNGDFMVAIERGDDHTKRYMLDKVKSAKICM